MLELLAAVCLVRGGHDIILAAFDNFKEVSPQQGHPVPARTLSPHMNICAPVGFVPQFPCVWQSPAPPSNLCLT